MTDDEKINIRLQSCACFISLAIHLSLVALLSLDHDTFDAFVWTTLIELLRPICDARQQPCEATLEDKSVNVNDCRAPAVRPKSTASFEPK